MEETMTTTEAAFNPEGTSRNPQPLDPPAVPPLSEGHAPQERRGADIYALVTDRIIEALEAGTGVPWKKPWAASGMPRNLVTGREYRGMNILLLALGQPYASPYWLTFKQALDQGGHVRKGEKGSLVTFWKFHREVMREATEDGETVNTAKERRAPLLRHYTVFNVEQCDGIQAPPVEGFTPKPHERIARCEAVVAGMPRPPEILRNPCQAGYSPVLDCLEIPELAQFDTPEDYYATLFHELTHATGHLSRLNRPSLGTPAPYGGEDYSKEEMVAELGSAFLCGHTGIFPRVAANSAAYIAGWLRALKQDKRLVPIAAAHAQRAADFILGVLPDHACEEA
jgi:antirestriction protein ArdC